MTSKEYTEDEIAQIKEQAVITADVGDLKATVPEIFSALKSLTISVADIPVKITECRNDMDKEIKSYMHGKFLTEQDLHTVERKMENRVASEVKTVNTKIDKVDKNVSKATWIVSGFISAGVFALWLMQFTDFFTHIHRG